MRAISIPSFGGPEALTLTEVPTPEPAPGQVRIQVAAAGVNRADTLQRLGFYPPPPGESELPGLEVSGTVQAIGEGVTQWQLGDRVCALLAGGGYDEEPAVEPGRSPAAGGEGPAQSVRAGGCRSVPVSACRSRRV